MRNVTGASHLGAGIIAALFLLCSGAEAADLGGDCCADLEERVAELEATTVRKGNTKVSVELYGRLHYVVSSWDDGDLNSLYVSNGSYSPSRYGLRGKAKIGGNWSSGYNLEMEDRNALSKFVDQFVTNPEPGGTIVRRSAIYLDHKEYGRLWWGWWSAAKDDITKDSIVIKGLDQTMHSDFYMNWSFFLRPVGAAGLSNIRFRDIGRCYSTSSSAFDCSNRRGLVRYDTAELFGFTGSASYGDDDIWSVALRYNKEWDNWKIGAGYAYEKFPDETFSGGFGVPLVSTRRDQEEWAGTVSIIHKPTGLWAWGTNSYSENNDPLARGFFTGNAPPLMKAWDIAGGLHRKFFDLGPTTIWGGYTMDEDGIGSFTSTVTSGGTNFPVWTGRIAPNRIPGIGFTTEITGAETTKWYAAIDQSIESASLNLFVAFQHIEPEISLVSADPLFSPNGAIRRVSVPLEDFDVFWMGGRINF